MFTYAWTSKNCPCGAIFRERVTLLDGKVYSGAGVLCPACRWEYQARKYENLAAKHRQRAKEWRAKKKHRGYPSGKDV